MFFETIIILLFTLLYLFLSDLVLNYLWKALKIDRSGNNKFLNLFYNTLLFSLFSVSILASIIAKGQTIFIFSIPLIYFLIKEYQKINVSSYLIKNNVDNKSLWFSIVFISVITLICSYYFTLKFSIRNDTAHYVKIAEYLADNGIENPYQYYNTENPNFKGLAPYHYFEMWFGGLFFRLNDLLGFDMFSNYLWYIYFVFNLFRIISIIGIFGLILKYVKFNALYFLITIPILIIDISAYCDWGLDAYVAESNLFERPNFIFYYLFLIPVFDAILCNDRKQQIIWSLFFIIASITAVPAIAGGLLLKFVYDFLRYKEERKSIFKLSVAFLIFIGLIAVFYKLFGVMKESMPIDNVTVSQMIAKTMSIWKACIYMFVMLSVKISVIIVLIYLLLLPKFSKQFQFDYTFKKVLLYLTLLCFTGIALFQLVPYLDNMYQFAFIGYCAVVLLLIIVLVIKLSTLTKVKLYAFSAVTLVVIFAGYKRNLFYDHIMISEVNWKQNLKENFLVQHGLSYEYVKELESEAPELKMMKGASLIDGKDADNDFLGLRHSITYQLGNYLMAFNNKVHLPLLSDKSKLYPDKDTTTKDYYKAKNFNRKTLFYRNYDDSISYRSNLENYIKDNKIGYLFASKSVKPEEYLDSLNIFKIIKDRNKGHQLILLKTYKK